MGIDIFLGANTPSGFYSCFEDFTKRAERLYIIKGSPGCGKSTMMKRLAAHAERLGGAPQRVYCSSDPASLDGVWFPEVSVMYIDGTAPHSLDPQTPGARDGIVDLGCAWDTEGLREVRDEIEAINYTISGCYREARSFMAAAAQVRAALYGSLRANADEYRLLRRRRRIIAAHIRDKKTNRRGQRFEVFTSALSPGGVTELNSYERWDVTELYDPYGIGGDIAESVAAAATGAGYDILASHDPLEPEGAPLQVIVPELRYVLLRGGSLFGGKPSGCRRIKLDHLAGSPAKLDREEQRLFTALMRAAQSRVQRAKELHDELESLYRPFVDFRQVDRLSDEHIRRLTRLYAQA